MTHRERPEVIVAGQNLVAGEPGMRELLADASCPVALAPYGHRFVGAFAPARVTVAGGPPGPTDDAVGFAVALTEGVGADLRLIAAGDQGAEDWLAHAQSLAPTAAATRVAGRPGGADARGRRPAGPRGPDPEVLRQAACPVLVLSASARAAHRVAAGARR